MNQLTAYARAHATLIKIERRAKEVKTKLRQKILSQRNSYALKAWERNWESANREGESAIYSIDQDQGLFDLYVHKR